MKLFKRSVFFVVLHCSFLYRVNQVDCQVGIIYSPFVQDGDNPDFTKSYSTEDVQKMLKLIAGDKFHQIATYSVGAPAEPYVASSTWKRCTSNVHTAIAAAKINNETRSHRSLTIFQGLSSTQGLSEEGLNSEIEVGFEVASIANHIYNGTVSALIFPSLEGFDELFQIVNRIKNVSRRARKKGLKFGVRLWDCFEKIPKRDKNDQDVKEMLKLFDFVICRRLPNVNTFAKGPESYIKIVTSDILAVENVINKEMGLATQVILETGWPGGTNLNGKNSVENMLHFWTLLRSWAIRNQRMVFLFEAFDNSWRDGKRDVLWGGNYGFWFRSGEENNSEGIYIRKAELISEDGLDPMDILTVGNLQMGILFGSFVLVLSSVIIVMIVLRLRVKKLKENRG